MKLVTAQKQPEPKPEDRKSDPQIRRAAADASTTAKDLRYARARRLGVKVLVAVVLPTAIAALYYGALASPEYESVSSFTVQSADGAGASSIEFLLAAVPGNSTTRDALLIQQYALSRTMMDQLVSDHGFVEHYSAETNDWFSRLAPSASHEDRYDYFREKVSVAFDSQSGMLTLRVRAFSADKASELAAAISQASERMVNEMMQAARSDRIALAQREVDAAEQRLRQAREAVVAIQGQRALLDPVESATAIVSVRSGIEAQLAEAEAELAALRANLQPGVPQLAEAQQRVAALRRQVERQSARLAGRDEHGLHTAIAEFEPAMVEKELAERTYASALKSLEVARVEADRQHRYLVTIAAPSRPDQATHPRVLVSVLTVFVVCLGLLAVGSLLLASIREHANL